MYGQADDSPGRGRRHPEPGAGRFPGPRGTCPPRVGRTARLHECLACTRVRRLRTDATLRRPLPRVGHTALLATLPKSHPRVRRLRTARPYILPAGPPAVILDLEKWSQINITPRPARETPSLRSMSSKRSIRIKGGACRLGTRSRT